MSLYGWKKSLLAVGYEGHTDRQEDRDRHTRFPGCPGNNPCWGRCELSRLQCLKKNKVEMKDDRKIMKSLEKRYDSWLQRVHNGELYPTKVRRYNMFEFDHNGFKVITNQ